MKMRYFYKIDNNKQPIPGSNIRRKSKPNGHQWRELFDPCCQPNSILCNCGPRFFVQLDGLNRPVDGSLIKRTAYPNMTQGVKYMEVQWMDSCCILDIAPFSASITGPTGTIYNGTDFVNFNLVTPIIQGEEYQLAAILSVEYFVDGVSVGIVSGNGLANPLHTKNYNFTLPSNADHTFEYYSVITFQGGVKYQTETQSFALQYNAAPAFGFPTGNTPLSLVMAPASVAELSSWVTDPNGIDDIVITFEGLPSFADTPIISDWAGARTFQIFMRPQLADVGSYPVTIKATDGVHEISRTVTVTVNNVALTTYAPFIYPLTPQTSPHTFVEGDFTEARYNRTATRTIGGQASLLYSSPAHGGDVMFGMFYITTGGNNVRYGSFYDPPGVYGQAVTTILLTLAPTNTNQGLYVNYPLLKFEVVPAP